MTTRYDTIGRAYAARRQPDPLVAASIRAALGDARSVVNVGAGTGSYEPTDIAVVAVEPSAIMRAQRPTGTAPAVAAWAEALPFADDAFDASLALLTVHHWSDVAVGLAELRRVARRHVVLTWDPAVAVGSDFWLVRDYFPDLYRDLVDMAAVPEVLAGFTGLPVDVLPVPVPHDCTDGFAAAYWRRPAAYLDPSVRGAISSFALRDDAAVADGLARLAADVASGAWDRRNRALLDRDTFDAGYRLVVAG